MLRLVMKWVLNSFSCLQGFGEVPPQTGMICREKVVLIATTSRHKEI